ncbi:MAG: TraB/VirB10 family protein, partial [Syntrophales bacterium]|nr:TraB/VirB10 family protein [Syntrophales bacterium]
MLNKIKDFWNQMMPRRKKMAGIITLILVIVLGGLVAYEIQGGRHESTPRYTKKEITLNTHLLEKSAYLESQKKLGEMGEQLKQLRETMGKASVNKAGTADKDSKDKVPTMAQPRVTIPVPPRQTLLESSNQALQNNKIAEPVQIIGEIGIVKNKDIISDSLKKEKKTLEDQIYLPPSFMEATLLSGLDAPTVENAKGNPVPVLLRIKDLAFLPNSVRANLKGCFVIAEGHGSLADERAHLRLVTLSCLSKKGRAVIDDKIKGFVVDTDGKIGLRGRVVSKMGATIARSVLAGFFGGLGSAIKSSTQNVAVSPLGELQTYDSNKILEAGVGEGIASGAEELQKFYMELARQTMPVIEVGATRTI